MNEAKYLTENAIKYLDYQGNDRGSTKNVYDVKRFLTERATEDGLWSQFQNKNGTAWRKLMEKYIHPDEWRMETEVNPKKDNVRIISRYVNSITGKPSTLIIPEDLSKKQRMNYPMKIKDELTLSFKREINQRIIPALRRRDFDAEPYVRFTSRVEVKNNEEEVRERKIPTKRRKLRLRSWSRKNKVFR